jgi:hypothetical protein
MGKGFSNNSMEEVVTIDGVLWLQGEIKVWISMNLEGFHGYDLNISFEYIKLGYQAVLQFNF